MKSVMKRMLLCTVALVFSAACWGQAPANDLCDQAIDLTEHLGFDIGDLQTTESFSNLDATGEPDLAVALSDIWGDDDSLETGASVDQSVWFHFTGDGHTYQLRTSACPGAAMYSNDTQMALYSGNCDSLELVGGNEDLIGFWGGTNGWWYSYMDVKLDAGEDYFLMVDGYNWDYMDSDDWVGVAQGSFCLNVMRTTNTEVQNTCSGALAIDAIFEPDGAGLSVAGPFDHTPLGSGIGPDETAPITSIECWGDGPTEDGSVWFTFEGDGNAYSIEQDICDEDNWAYQWGFDSQMALYKGSCDEAVAVSCAEDWDAGNSQWWSRIGFDTEVGETYYLRYDGFHWTFNGMEWTANGAFCLKAYAGNINVVDVLESLDLEVFPNPTCDGRVRLDWDGAEPRADVGVFDAHGRQVDMILRATRGQDIQLDLPSGHYVLGIRTDAGAASVQVQIQR